MALRSSGPRLTPAAGSIASSPTRSRCRPTAARPAVTSGCAGLARYSRDRTRKHVVRRAGDASGSPRMTVDHTVGSSTRGSRRRAKHFRQQSRHRGALSAVQRCRAVFGQDQGLQPQRKLQVRIVRHHLGHRAMEPDSVQSQDGSENFNNPLSGVEINAPGTIGFYLPGGTARPGHGNRSLQPIQPGIGAASSGSGPFNWVGGLFYSRFRSTWNLYTAVENPFGLRRSRHIRRRPPFPRSGISRIRPRSRNMPPSARAPMRSPISLKATAGVRGTPTIITFYDHFAGWGSPSGRRDARSRSCHAVRSWRRPQVQSGL